MPATRSCGGKGGGALAVLLLGLSLPSMAAPASTGADLREAPPAAARPVGRGERHYGWGIGGEVWLQRGHPLDRQDLSYRFPNAPGSDPGPVRRDPYSRA